MAVFEQLAEEKKNFYDWQVGNGSGYRVIIDEKSGKPVIKSCGRWKSYGISFAGCVCSGICTGFYFW